MMISSLRSSVLRRVNAQILNIIAVWLATNLVQAQLPGIMAGMEPLQTASGAGPVQPRHQSWCGVTGAGPIGAWSDGTLAPDEKGIRSRGRAGLDAPSGVSRGDYRAIDGTVYRNAWWFRGVSTELILQDGDLDYLGMQTAWESVDLQDLLFSYGSLILEHPCGSRLRHGAVKNCGSGCAVRGGCQLEIDPPAVRDWTPYRQFFVPILVHEMMHTFDRYRGLFVGPDPAHAWTAFSDPFVQYISGHSSVDFGYRMGLAPSDWLRRLTDDFLGVYESRRDLSWQTYVVEGRNDEYRIASTLVQGGILLRLVQFYGVEAMRRAFAAGNDPMPWATAPLSRLISMMSAGTGEDLSPAFEWWRVPVDAQTKEALAARYPKTFLVRDADGDGFNVLDGDLEDEDPASTPGRKELLNGKDDDADGIVDNVHWEESQDLPSEPATAPSTTWPVHLSGNVAEGEADVLKVSVPHPMRGRLRLRSRGSAPVTVGVIPPGGEWQTESLYVTPWQTTLMAFALSEGTHALRVTGSLPGTAYEVWLEPAAPTVPTPTTYAIRRAGLPGWRVIGSLPPPELGDPTGLEARFWVGRLGWVGTNSIETANQSPTFDWVAPADFDPGTQFHRMQWWRAGLPVSPLSERRPFEIPGGRVLEVTTTEESGPGSLRAALSEANHDLAKDEIRFRIPGPGPHLIHLQTPLPPILYPAVVDGATQPGFSGVPLVQVDGSALSGEANGFWIIAADTVIRGLSVTGFPGSGIRVQGNSVAVEGCLLGLMPGGLLAAGNRSRGIQVESTNVVIGGALPAQGNVISGNAQAGIELGRTAASVSLWNNRIGTDLTGTFAVPNQGPGIRVYSPALNQIGMAGAGNLISGNGHTGISIEGAFGGPPGIGPHIAGNVVGLNDTGTRAIPNQSDGIWIGYRGDALVDGNIVSGNRGSGITLGTATATNVTIRGNRVGTDRTGKSALGNRGHGIWANSGQNTIGGVGVGNQVAGNAYEGIVVTGDRGSNRVQGNWIGVDATGNRRLPNGGVGINVGSPGNHVGGVLHTEGNLVSGNLSAGILVTGNAATGNVIEGNQVGSDAAGRLALGNFGGIAIHAPANRVGSPDPARRNLVSGNVHYGIQIAGPANSGNEIMGNYVGTTLDGRAALGNRSTGIEVSSPFTRIHSGNVVSGNGDRGISVHGGRENQYCRGTQITGNLIGLGADGRTRIGNRLTGISLSEVQDMEIGGPGIAGNRIAGNGEHGIRAWGDSCRGLVLRGNVIGADIDGTLVGNAEHGILLFAFQVQIGGDSADEANWVVGSGQNGVSVQWQSTGVAILRNVIRDSQRLGIDLETRFGWGPSPQVEAGTDPGRSILQGFPVLDSAVQTHDSVTVRGSFRGASSGPYRLDFYGIDAPRLTNGEGERWLGRLDVSASAETRQPFEFTLPGMPAWVTATVTDPSGNTSEFATNIFVSPRLGQLRMLQLPSNALVLTWAAPSGGLRIESTTNLVPPVSWQAITNLPTRIDGADFILLPWGPDAARFYRAVGDP